MRTLRPVNQSPQEQFWAAPEDDVVIPVTNLHPDEANPEQLALLYDRRFDTENVVDELKNQWGFRGYGLANR